MGKLNFTEFLFLVNSTLFVGASSIRLLDTSLKTSDKASLASFIRSYAACINNRNRNYKGNKQFFGPDQVSK